ncbi:hypothetical protein HW132_31995 [Brasilonema sp. CT11]|nr:hypothetical protein [Brasilonema sp. CT11]
MTTYIKRIQSKLKRNGVSLSLADIRAVYQLVINSDEPTPEQLDEVYDQIMSQQNALVTTPQSTEIMTDDEMNNFQAFVNSDEFRSSSFTETEIQPAQESEEPSSSDSETALTVAEKQELVTTQASSMGIELSQDDALKIATDVDENSIDITESLGELKGLILAYVAAKKAKMQQVQREFRDDINMAAEDFYETVQSETQLTNQALAQIATNQRERTTAIKQDYKKKVSFFREALKLN